MRYASIKELYTPKSTFQHMVYIMASILFIIKVKSLFTKCLNFFQNKWDCLEINNMLAIGLDLFFWNDHNKIPHLIFIQLFFSLVHFNGIIIVHTLNMNKCYDIHTVVLCANHVLTFFAAVLNASLWLMAGLLALILRISSLKKFM